MIVKELTLETIDQSKKTESLTKASDTAAGLFNDLFAFNNEPKEETSLFEKKEEKKKDPNVKLGIEEEFDEVNPKIN